MSTEAPNPKSQLNPEVRQTIGQIRKSLDQGVFTKQETIGQLHNQGLDLITRSEKDPDNPRNAELTQLLNAVGKIPQVREDISKRIQNLADPKEDDKESAAKLIVLYKWYGLEGQVADDIKFAAETLMQKHGFTSDTDSALMQAVTTRDVSPTTSRRSFFERLNPLPEGLEKEKKEAKELENQYPELIKKAVEALNREIEALEKLVKEDDGDKRLTMEELAKRRLGSDSLRENIASYLFELRLPPSGGNPNIEKALAFMARRFAHPDRKLIALGVRRLIREDIALSKEKLARGVLQKLHPEHEKYVTEWEEHLKTRPDEEIIRHYDSLEEPEPPGPPSPPPPPLLLPLPPQQLHQPKYNLQKLNLLYRKKKEKNITEF